MKTTLILSLSITLSSGLAAQVQITLAECHRLAEASHPLSAHMALAEKRGSETVELLKYTRYPHASMNAQATYQSDVTKVEANIPGVDIPYPSNDQYRVSLDVLQPIYDGGSVRARQEVATLSARLEVQQAETGLLELREQINRIYAAILMEQEKAALLRVGENTLLAQRKAVRSGIANGVLLPAAADRLQVEALKVHQQLKAAEAERAAYLEVLSGLTGKPLAADVQLAMPQAEQAENYTLDKRPEISAFALERQLKEAGIMGINARSAPQLSVFAQAGYGRPGLNMLDDTFQPYYLAGLQFSWNLSALFTARREKELQRLQQQVIDKREEAFLLTVSTGMIRLKNEIEQLVEVLNDDGEIISLQEKIAATASSQLQQGVTTASEYIRAQNELREAKLNRKMHLIRLRMKQAEWRTQQGLTID
ncbi:MAG: TolC family protein [Flavobacteriales bacterium]